MSGRLRGTARVRRVRSRLAPALLLGAPALLLGCDARLPVTRKSTAPPAADTAEGFARSWGTHCAGCHGANGSLGPARPMNDPLYMASVSDAELVRVISAGSPAGTLMPGFSAAAGGSLSDDEIAAIVSGMRRAWSRPDTKPSPVPYAAPTTRGSADRGKAAFDRACVACHADGSASDAFMLQLVSDQSLRSTIIFGRPDLGMPGAAGPFPNRPPSETLSAQDVDDLVAWLAQRRSEDWPPKSIQRGGRP